ncbi:hypothetical protein PanWU01x14_272310 [Parasponia andersonii]|uniref:Uncharacterized protein n=1 Tax=Parasponia andersonii TaxID=3476 RepID=A0A2P5B489_PARAD|nr:hypothetical protein PanWU01x14_272310 [Parasponia andersonii]
MISSRSKIMRSSSIEESSMIKWRSSRSEKLSEALIEDSKELEHGEINDRVEILKVEDNEGLEHREMGSTNIMENSYNGELNYGKLND